MAKYGMNRVTLIGNLGKDPEVRHLDQGIAVATLNLACTERFRDKDGNYKDRTEWIYVTVWRGQAEVAGKFLRKGSSVCVEGRLINRSWETPEGEKRSRIEVEGVRLILLDRPTQSDFQASAGGGSQSEKPAIGQQLPSVEDTDDLPF